MALIKPFLFVAAAGFLAACEEPFDVEPMPGTEVERGMVNASLVSNAGVAGKLDVASQNGNVITYGYYTDVIGEMAVRGAADAYCGGQGKAGITGAERSAKGGRGYNLLSFACRA